jgi:hypothetical protein
MALACVVTALALASARPAGAGEPLRVALAFVLLVLAPGAAIALAIGVTPPGGRVLAAGWALGFGVAWLAAGVMAARSLGLPFLVLTRAGAPWAALPWLAAAWLSPHTRMGPAGHGMGPAGAAAAPSRLGLVAGLTVALAAALALVHVATHGPPITYLSDSPDHLGTVRRMLASGDAFPRDAFFHDAGAAGVDPRKGLWHPVVALVCALSGVDPIPAWHALSALLAPFLVVTAASFAFRLGGPLAAAAGAWGMVLGYGGGLSTQYLSEAVFSTKLADGLALATAVALLCDLDQRTARSRLAVAGLVLGTIATHVFGALQFAIAFGALGAGLALRDRGASPVFLRLVATSAACAAAAAPYLAWRALHSFAPLNPIHTETQGLLELSPGVRVVSVGALWDWLGPLWVLFPFSLVAWARAAREPAALYLLTTTLAVGVLMLCPPLVALLEPRVGYLLMRLPWLLPVGPAVAFLVVRAREWWRRGRRLRAAAPAALLGLALAGPLSDAVLAVWAGRADAAGAGETAMRPWADALAWLDNGLPQGSVVLSDPATSYAIPAFTRHWVTCLADQHSSPNDSLALARILDARDALDPWAPWSATARAVRRWGATAIALNGRIDARHGLDYWTPTPEWYAAARARLERAPAAFERVYERDRFSVYAIHRDALDRLANGELPRPFVRTASGSEPGRSLGAGLPELVSFRLDADAAARGESLSGAIEWRARAPLAPGIYSVAIRFDRALPADVPRPPGAFSKVWRKAVERWRHERYRFRADHLPTGGSYGVDRWAADEVVGDRFRVDVPRDVAPGEYTVKVTMIHQPHYPNLRLQDLLSDDDLLDGLAVAKLRVVGAR